MATRLRTAIAAIEPYFTTAFGQPVPFRIGNTEWNEHGKAPLVGWIQRGGKILKPEPVGSADQGIGDDCEEQALVAQLHTNEADVLVKLWGRSDEEAEQLFESLFVALLKTPGVRADSRDGTYSTPSEFEGAHLKHGDLIEVPIKLYLTVPAETTHTVQFVTITAHEQDITADSEDEVFHSEHSQE